MKSGVSRWKNDLILCGVIFLLILILYFVFVFSSQCGKTVSVSYNGKVVGEYSLFENREEEFCFDGHSHNTLEIKNGTVKMIFADCPDKICVHHAEISNVGESIICLPHKIVVTVNEK